MPWQYARSRDGSRVPVVGNGATGDRPKRVVEVTTGRTVGRVPGLSVHFLPDGRILSLRVDRAELYDARGRLLDAQLLPADLRGRRLSIGWP